MKQINEMSLRDCLDAIRELETPDIRRGWHGQIADRIHKIWEVEQDGLIAITDAYKHLKECIRWVPFDERQPSGSDGKLILVYDKYRGVYEIEQNQIRDYNPTHWRRIDTP